MHFLVLLLLLTQAFAHQTSLTGTGNPVRWTNKNLPVTIMNGTSDLPSTTSTSLIQTAIAQWNNVSSTKITAQGSSVNQIKFTNDFAIYGSAVIGVTQLNYNSAGVVTKATILLNDNYQFTSTPAFGYSGQVFLGDVVTHELGHFLGLGHSEVLNSTMFFSAFPGQSTLAYDDKSGVREKYDTGFGKISGYVQGGNHIGILGVHVQAISRKTGESIGAISDEDGYFEINGLEYNDTFYLYTSPIKKLDSLPGNFANIKTGFCPASYVGAFFNKCGRNYDGAPQGINITASEPNKYVGVVSVQCALKSSEDYSYQKIQTTFAPVTIYDYADDHRSEKSFVGYFPRPTTMVPYREDILSVDLTGYTPAGTQKYLKVSLHGQAFGNQLEYTMSGKQNGINLPAASLGMTYVSNLQTYQADFSAFLPLSHSLAENNFEFHISATKLSASTLARTIPSSALFSSIDYLPYLFVTSIWELNSMGELVPVMDNGQVLSDNSSCLDAPLTYSVSKVVTSLLDSQDSTDASGVSAAGCGTIEPPNSSGPGSGLFLLTLGFLLSVLGHSIIKTSKKFLS
jgi:Matrixin